MTMRLAMYKGPASDPLHRLAHRFTCWWTRSRYSHVELVFDRARDGRWLCASASARDGGVRLKYIELESGHWDVFDLHQVPVTEAIARAWFYRQADARAAYDWLGLLWFVLPVKAINNPRRWFCSEAVAAALGLPKPHKFHPQKLLESLTHGAPRP